VFHWPADRIPVRFYAQPSGNLPYLTERASGVWASMFLYDEFAGQLVSDSAAADVIVLADSAPDVVPDTGPPVFACTGVTLYPPVDSTNRLTGRLHVQLTVLSGYTAAQVAACLRRTTIHEIGHALGLLQHSPNAGDIMHGPPVVDLPSEQDRRTVERLYHTPATVLPPS
jgi:predicted Zn-dependent protease